MEFDIVDILRICAIAFKSFKTPELMWFQAIEYRCFEQNIENKSSDGTQITPYITGHHGEHFSCVYLCVQWCVSIHCLCAVSSWTSNHCVSILCIMYFHTLKWLDGWVCSRISPYCPTLYGVGSSPDWRFFSRRFLGVHCWKLQKLKDS